MGSGKEAGHRRRSSFPTGAFLVVVALVCLGLAVSAGYNFVRLDRLRQEYLSNHAAEIGNAIDGQARGMNRSNPSFWQGLFAESIAAHSSSVAFLALIDDSGRVIVNEGDRFAPVFGAPAGMTQAQGTRLYIHDIVLPVPEMGMGAGPGRGPGMGPGMGRGGGMGGRRPSSRHLRIGMYASEADFIRWQAIMQLAMSGVAILTLLALSGYFLHTLRRFLRLKEQEESAKHLTYLGSMAATLAHEIRNPLGAMKGLTQLAQEDLPSDHRTQSLMSTVVREAERLEKLVTDLLTFARPRDPQVNEFDFLLLLADIRTGLQPKLESAGISLKINAGPPVLPIHSDESGLRQVLLNILLNAIDSAPPGGKITVTVGRDEKDGMLIADIDDSGPGLGDRDPEDLFQPFATTKVQGTGLGLPISRQIIERLHGNLRLANGPGGGARCTIRVPLRPPRVPVEVHRIL
jgi:signal transduction histidine kinase